jgi:YggT family protein
VSSLPLASIRGDVGNYVDVLAYLYTLVIILYVLSSLMLSLGVRIPYNRATNAVLTFLRQVCEPYLRIFRRILPSFGGLDFSPIVGIIIVRLAGSLLSRVIRGS